MIKTLKRLKESGFMKKNYLISVIQLWCLLIANFAMSQQELPTVSTARKQLDLDIDVAYNSDPLYLTVEQNTFIKTKADGFTIKTSSDPDKFRRIGKTNISWQAKGLYEIILYTDYFGQKLLSPLDFIPGGVIPFPLNPDNPTQLKLAINLDKTISKYTGLYPRGGDDPNNGTMTLCVPLKLWTQSTAGPLLDGSGLAESTAPYTDNTAQTQKGIISRLHWYGMYTPDRRVWAATQYPNYSADILYITPTDVLFNESLWNSYTASHPSDPVTNDEKKHPDPCYTSIPDKNAITLDKSNVNFGQIGSYKKVIASTRMFTWPLKAELTFAIDLSDANLRDNTIFEGKVYIDLVGN